MIIKAPKARCDICPLATNDFVPATINNSKMILLAEAPGFYEVEKKAYLVGAAGRQLDEIIQELGYKKLDFNLLNSCCCRPLNQFQKNRTPTDIEVYCCNERLKDEIDQIKPDMIIALGKVAFVALGGNVKTQMASVTGNIIVWRGYDVMVTYHPAAILHSGGSTSERGGMIRGKLKQHLEKAITSPPSEKQLSLW